MKVLFVSIAFPPKNNPECLQTGKYLKSLVKYRDFFATAITSASPTLFMPDDPTLEIDLREKVKTIKIRIPENKYVNFIVRKAWPTWLQLPDTKFLFHLQWRKALKEIGEKPDLIYSRSYPLSSTIMARHLAEHFAVPWIIHLSDPWVDNPLVHWTKKAFKKNIAWEEECFRVAKYITVTSEGTSEYYMNKFPQWKQKFVVMPNVYDSDDISTHIKSINVNEPLHIVYTGGLVETRTAEPIFKALQMLRTEDPSLMKKITFSLAGQFDRYNKSMFNKYDLPCVKNLGLLSYEDAKKLQRDAHILVALDSPAVEKEWLLFFPSKLLDYIASGKRILAITGKDSASYSVINNKYGDCSDHQDVEGIAKLIKTYLRQYQAGNEQYFTNEIGNDTFSASYNTERLFRLFADTIKGEKLFVNETGKIS